MNHFEFYGLPLSFHPDQQLVRQKFYELSKKYHPDFYVNESEERQNEVLELSTLNNKAFQVLKDPTKTLSYLLQLKGMLPEGENYVLPQDFLMEMMGINEALMELEFDADDDKHQQVKTAIHQIETSLNEELELLTLNFDSASADEQTDTLKNIKDLYYRGKYIARLKERVIR